MATVSKRLRYEVLRRDNFACRYCGASAPDAKLTVDAVVPEALGGSHKDPSNLVAACDACNGGKSATPPDASLVADVAQDAIRWSQAMKLAAGEMLAQDGKLTEAQERFAACWDNWTYDDDGQRRTIPKDPGWRESINALLAAGLPITLLEQCVQITMSRRKLAIDNHFRYMCGVAWNKVAELQERARELAGSKTSASELPAAAADPHEQGRGDFARELLAEVTAEERDYYLKQVDVREYLDEDDEPQTENQLACDAVSSLLNSVRCDWDYLARRVEETLGNLPDGIGERALAPRKDKLGELSGPVGRRTFRLTDALIVADDLLNLPAARERLNAMTAPERVEWHAYAVALYHRADLDEDQLTSRAAQCAQVIAEGRHWNDMCIGRGEAIPACPRRGTNYARIAGAECCEPGGPPDHKGHVVCDHHLEELIEGTYIGANGEAFSATDYAAVGSDPWDF